jgi:hypothetical protein
MVDASRFPEVFGRLRKILEPYDFIGVRLDSADNYVIEGPPSPARLRRPTYFGEARIRKNYVSFYLMPVYAFPDLLDTVSSDLIKRMQGKSCFNFTVIDEERFAELEALTKVGYERYREEGLV